MENENEYMIDTEFTSRFAFFGYIASSKSHIFLL